MYAAQKSDHLSGKLLEKDYIGFWRDWKKASRAKCPPVNRIDDAVVEPDIANTFKSYFQQIYGEDSTDAHGRLRAEFMERFPAYFTSKQHDSISPYLLSWEDMVAIAGKLKTGKSTGSFLKAEHLINGSPKMMIHIHLLFNAFIQHGFVPADFLQGTISPTVKDGNGDLHSTDNYRGITLCSTLSHLFENALRLKFGK